MVESSRIASGSTRLLVSSSRVAAALLAVIVAVIVAAMLSSTTNNNNNNKATTTGDNFVLLERNNGGAAAAGTKTTIRFPLVAFGLPAFDDADADTDGDAIIYNLTTTALEVGYRNFVVDAAHQKAFAQAIADAAPRVPRQAVFITGSVPSLDTANSKEDDLFGEFTVEDKFSTPMTEADDEYNRAYEWTRRACREIMAAFAAGGVDTLDSMLLDVPPGWSCDWIRGQWRRLEELVVHEERVRTLAVSNFSPRQLDCLLRPLDANNPHHHLLKVKPIVNQLPFNVAFHRDEVLQENRNRGVLVQAWSPLGGSHPRKFRATVKAACAEVGKRYGKSFAQVALRWIVQKGAAFATRSSDRRHLAEDLDIFDFELSSNDMAFLDSLASAA